MKTIRRLPAWRFLNLFAEFEQYSPNQFRIKINTLLGHALDAWSYGIEDSPGFRLNEQAKRSCHSEPDCHCLSPAFSFVDTHDAHAFVQC